MNFKSGDMVLCIKEDSFKDIAVGNIYEIDHVILFKIVDYPTYVYLKNGHMSYPASNFVKVSSLVKELF